MVMLARAGVGIVQILDFLVTEQVACGPLIEILSAHRDETRSFALVYPNAIRQTPAVGATAEFIVEQSKLVR